MVTCTHCRTTRSIELFRSGNRTLRTCLPCRERLNNEATRRVAMRALIPAARQWNMEDPTPLPNIHRCSPMHYECKNCKALHYLEEKLAVSSNRNPVFTSCCANGKVKLPTLQEPPANLKHLLTASTPSMFLKPP
jgi:hypothetical protein